MDRVDDPSPRRSKCRPGARRRFVQMDDGVLNCEVLAFSLRGGEIGGRRGTGCKHAVEGPCGPTRHPAPRAQSETQIACACRRQDIAAAHRKPDRRANECGHDPGRSRADHVDDPERRVTPRRWSIYPPNTKHDRAVRDCGRVSSRGPPDFSARLSRRGGDVSRHYPM